MANGILDPEPRYFQKKSTRLIERSKWLKKKELKAVKKGAIELLNKFPVVQFFSRYDNN